MYAISDSGVTVLPVGKLESQRAAEASKESLLFQGNSCDRQPIVQTVDINDWGSAHTDFALTLPSDVSGISMWLQMPPGVTRLSWIGVWIL